MVKKKLDQLIDLIRMDNDKNYDIVVLPGMGMIDKKYQSKEDVSIEKSKKDENIDVTKRHSRWMFLNNHLNNILRRKVMLEYIVQLNNEYNQDRLPYGNFYDRPNLDDEIHELESKEDRYYQNNESDSHFSYKQENDKGISNLSGYKKGNSRFLRSNLIQHMNQQDLQNLNNSNESNRIETEFYSPAQNRFLNTNLHMGNDHALKIASSGNIGQKYSNSTTDQTSMSLSIPSNNLNKKNSNYKDPNYQYSDIIEERGCEMLDSIRSIKDKAKNDILYKLMDGEWHHEKELIRLAKKSRYIGQVSFGMMMYSFKEMISDDFMMKKIGVEGDAIYKIDDNFVGLVRAAYMNYQKSVY